MKQQKSRRLRFLPSLKGAVKGIVQPKFEVLPILSLKEEATFMAFQHF